MTDERKAAIDAPGVDSVDDGITETTIESLVKAARALVRGELSPAIVAGLNSEDLYRMADFGYDLMEAGRCDDARVIFEELGSLNPYDAYFQAVLGSIAQRQSEYSRAAESYGRAVALDPEDTFSWVNRAEVLLHLCRRALDQGDPAAALTSLGEVDESLRRVRESSDAAAAPARERACRLAGTADRLRALVGRGGSGGFPPPNLGPSPR